MFYTLTQLLKNAPYVLYTCTIMVTLFILTYSSFGQNLLHILITKETVDLYKQRAENIQNYALQHHSP